MPSCCVPHCSSGYSNNKNKERARSKINEVHFFKFPKDPEMFKKWERRIKREDRPLRPTDSVCSIHFQSEFIITDYEIQMPDGVHRIKRGRATLKAGAFPTIFPGYPVYLNQAVNLRKFPKKRKVADSILVTVPLQTSSNSRNALLPDLDSGSSILPPKPNTDEIIEWFSTVNPVNWNICLSENLKCIFFLQFNYKFELEKKVIIMKETLQAKIYIRDIELNMDHPRYIQSTQDLDQLFTEVNNMKICTGPEVST